MNKQSRIASFMESVWQVAIGFFIAYAAWKWGVHPAIEAGWFAASDAFVITCIFTFISLVRGFLVRRASVAWSAWRQRVSRTEHQEQGQACPAQSR